MVEQPWLEHLPLCSSSCTHFSLVTESQWSLDNLNLPDSIDRLFLIFFLAADYVHCKSTFVKLTKQFCYMRFITGTKIFLLIQQTLFVTFTNCLLNEHKQFYINTNFFVIMTKNSCVKWDSSLEQIFLYLTNLFLQGLFDIYRPVQGQNNATNFFPMHNSISVE